MQHTGTILFLSYLKLDSPAVRWSGTPWQMAGAVLPPFCGMYSQNPANQILHTVMLYSDSRLHGRWIFQSSLLQLKATFKPNYAAACIQNTHPFTQAMTWIT
jgi:hypothetical protein